MDKSNIVVSEVVRTLIQERLRGSEVCVAYSGGCDSTALLSVLVALADDFRLTVSALHVNHCMSKNSYKWEDFCRSKSNELGVRFFCERVKVDSDSGLGIEASAREARYEIFSKHQSSVMMLAHHLDDQIETYLLRLVRGSGVKGLSCMSSVSAQWNNQGPIFIRPWLDVQRSMIQEWADDRGLQWIEDESNLDSKFDRNFFRSST